MFKSFSKTKLLLKKPKQEKSGDTESKSRTSRSAMSTPSPSLLRRATGMSDISSTPKAIIRTPLLESPKRPPTGLALDSESKRIKLEDGMQEKSGECEKTGRQGKEGYCNRSIVPKAEEEIGAGPLCINYGRHIVSSVNKQSTETRLILKSGDSKTCCVLRDSWVHHAVDNIKENDVVNVIGAKKSAVEGEIIVDNSTGLIVVNPDRLISGTSVVATLFCQRKAILNDIFRGLEGTIHNYRVTQ